MKSINSNDIINIEIAQLLAVPKRKWGFRAFMKVKCLIQVLYFFDKQSTTHKEQSGALLTKADL